MVRHVTSWWPILKWLRIRIDPYCHWHTVLCESISQTFLVADLLDCFFMFIIQLVAKVRQLCWHEAVKRLPAIRSLVVLSIPGIQSPLTIRGVTEVFGWIEFGMQHCSLKDAAGQITTAGVGHREIFRVNRHLLSMYVDSAFRDSLNYGGCILGRVGHGQIALDCGDVAGLGRALIDFSWFRRVVKKVPSQSNLL